MKLWVIGSGHFRCSAVPKQSLYQVLQRCPGLREGALTARLTQNGTGWHCPCQPAPTLLATRTVSWNSHPVSIICCCNTRCIQVTCWTYCQCYFHHFESFRIYMVRKNWSPGKNIVAKKLVVAVKSSDGNSTILFGMRATRVLRRVDSKRVSWKPQGSAWEMVFRKWKMEGGKLIGNG